MMKKENQPREKCWRERREQYDGGVDSNKQILAAENAPANSVGTAHPKIL